MTNPTISREDAISMLKLAIGWIRGGKTDVAINQLWFLVDNLEVAVALDELLIAREIGCSAEFLCQ